MCVVSEKLKEYLPRAIFDSLMHFSIDKRESISEIRLRLMRASTITIGNRNEILIDYKTGNSIMLSQSDIDSCFKRICENSIYKYESEIKNGYITLPSGCRIGFCGSRVESGFIKNISSINIRISKEIVDAGAEIFPQIYTNKTIHSSLIVSQPCAGKTTILTDLAKRLSESMIRCAIIDERGEIAACHNGVPRKNVGLLSDVLDDYPKGEGMMIALRSLSPQVLICDEIGSKEDVEAMLQALNAGVPVIASAHATDARQLLSRPQMRYLIENNVIEKFFFLDGPNRPGKLKKVILSEEIYESIGHNHDVSGVDMGRKGIS